MITRIRQFIRENRLIQPGETGVVAVSGGPDSIALLHILSKVIGPELGLTLVAAHLDHNLRQERSKADARFVADLCRNWGIVLASESRDVPATKPKGESVENWARVVRYGFLRDVAKRVQSNWIATGHTASDQAETVLMRLLSGAGIRGLQGILPVRPDGVIRPLLCLFKSEILSYLNQSRIEYRIDETNADTRYLRNHIRHNLLPRMVRQQPHCELELIKIAGHARRTWADLSIKVQDEARRVITRTDRGYFSLDLRSSLSYPTYVLREFLSKIAVARPTEAHIKALDELCRKQPGKSVKIPGHRVWRTAEGLWAVPNRKSECTGTYTATLGIPVAMEKEGAFVYSSLVERPSGFPAASASEAYFDADSIGENWTYRFWQEGDSFSPLGLGGKRKKVSDLLGEKRIPVPQRKRTMIMETQKGIAWVVGLRIGEPFRVRNDSQRIMRVFITYKESLQI